MVVGVVVVVVVVVVMMTMTKALCSVPFEMDPDDRVAEVKLTRSIPKWHPKCSETRQDRGQERAAQQEMTLSPWLPACLCACLRAFPHPHHFRALTSMSKAESTKHEGERTSSLTLAR